MRLDGDGLRRRRLWGKLASPSALGVLDSQRWGGVGREETIKRDPCGWRGAGLEQKARELGHVNVHLTSGGVRGAQVWLSKAKARQVFVTVGPSDRVVLLAIAPIMGRWWGAIRVMVKGS